MSSCISKTGVSCLVSFGFGFCFPLDVEAASFAGSSSFVHLCLMYISVSSSVDEMSSCTLGFRLAFLRRVLGDVLLMRLDASFICFWFLFLFMSSRNLLSSATFTGLGFLFTSSSACCDVEGIRGCFIGGFSSSPFVAAATS